MDLSGQSDASPCNSTTNESSLNRYQPSSWNYDFLQSLGTDDNGTGEVDTLETEKLRGELKSLISDATMEPLPKMELIEVVVRLGLKWRFESEIKGALQGIDQDGGAARWHDDLHAVALRFRLLRQNGMCVSKDVFKKFKDRKGEFKEQNSRALLSLYEASSLSWEGEDILDEAMAFTIKHLENVKDTTSQDELSRRVMHSLELPLHWRVPRFEARHFIDVYAQEEGMLPNLLKLAKLDFNFAQSVHQIELGKLARWWVGTGLDKLSFSRNNLVQSYMWGCAIVSEPHFGHVRDALVKIGSMITIVDDVYDVYGSMEELELFTAFIDRWNTEGVERLPETIKMVLLTVFHNTNEIGYGIKAKRGLEVIPLLAKGWGDLCKAYLKEARWSHTGYKPTLEEYTENGLISIGFPLLMVTAFVAIANTQESLHLFHSMPPLVRHSSLLNRLINDLGTYTDELARGDDIKSIQCYMNQTGASEEAARKHIKAMIHETWKSMNKCSFDQSHQSIDLFTRFNVNSVRGSHFFYQFGDGYGVTESWTKDHLLSVLLRPLPTSIHKS